MYQKVTVTEAKARFSEMINRVIFQKEKFTVTKKGKAVAIVAPIEQDAASEEGLIRAKGALAGADRFVDEMLEFIYSSRTEESDRKVDL